MSTARHPLLSRLRRHRGLWVLAVCVLLLKFATGTVCLADGVPTPGAGEPVAALVDDLADVAVAPALSGGETGCLLGEGSDCHCACAHSVPLPAALAAAVTTPLIPLIVPALGSDRVAAAPASLLRPPIS